MGGRGGGGVGWCFFFQAEDGIRDYDVTGVQTCALPISAGGDWELQMYEKTGIGDGTHANNPWLQELPDPVSKVCWDNYLTMNPDEMKDRGFNTVLGQVQEADLVEVTVNGVTQALPVYPQYGQTKGTLEIGRAACRERA